MPVELAVLEILREMGAPSIEAQFEEGVPEVGTVPDASFASRVSDTLHWHVRSLITSLIDAITPHRPVSFLSNEPSLKEMLLDRYGDHIPRQ